MRKRFIATIVCSAVSLIGASGCALAETIGRYQCSVIDIPGQEPIGDRPGHFLVSLQYSCFRFQSSGSNTTARRADGAEGVIRPSG